MNVMVIVQLYVAGVDLGMRTSVNERDFISLKVNFGVSFVLVENYFMFTSQYTRE